MCSLAPNKINANYNTLGYHHISQIRLAKIQKLQKLLQKWLGPGPPGMEVRVMELGGQSVVPLCRANGASAASAGFLWG